VFLRVIFFYDLIHEILSLEIVCARRAVVPRTGKVIIKMLQNDILKNSLQKVYLKIRSIVNRQSSEIMLES